MDFINDFDTWLLLKINKEWAHPYLDLFFTTITDYHKTKSFKFIFLPLFLGSIVYVQRKRSFFTLLFLTLALAFSDYINGKVLKYYFERLRPSVDGIDVILRAPHFGGYSFPSNHAINIFCAATFLCLCFPKIKYWVFGFAALVSYSRTYVGVHYPLDVVAGSIFGILIGYSFYKVSYIFFFIYFLVFSFS